MKNRNVVIETLSYDLFDSIVDMLEEMGVNIVEKRYDLLWKRYEIYAKVNLRQSYKLRHFLKSRDARIMDFGA